MYYVKDPCVELFWNMFGLDACWTLQSQRWQMVASAPTNHLVAQSKPPGRVCTRGPCGHSVPRWTVGQNIIHGHPWTTYKGYKMQSTAHPATEWSVSWNAIPTSSSFQANIMQVWVNMIPNDSILPMHCSTKPKIGTYYLCIATKCDAWPKDPVFPSPATKFFHIRCAKRTLNTLWFPSGLSTVRWCTEEHAGPNMLHGGAHIIIPVSFNLGCCNSEGAKSFFS